MVTLAPAACAHSAPPATGSNKGAEPVNLPADPFAIISEAERLAERDLWPGFAPARTPVAIFDGERTWLFRHPAPPEDFRPVEGHNEVYAHPGRHPLVTANTSVEIAGVRTATLMPGDPGVALVERAGTLIHEAFHVFQREKHPAWSANEAALFTYPVDDPELLALRRLETEALRRALEATRPDSTACWATRAMGYRHERFARLPAEAVAYERGTELNEGLATYIEHRATGEAGTEVLPEIGFAPEDVRLRGYETGLAMGILLDRLAPGWHRELEQDDSASLDALLASRLEVDADSASGCSFAPAERDSIAEAAERDAATLEDRRADLRRDFLAQPGWRIVVETSGSPLFPQGFDPLNVQVVGDGEVLHTRFVKLGSEAGTVEVLGHSALTEAAGDHPLFQGVRRLTVAGLESEPTITKANGVVAVAGEGVRGELKSAAVERTGRTVTIRLISNPSTIR